MKLLFACVAAFLVSAIFFPGCNTSCRTQTAPKTIYKTLNNVDAQAAGMMIEHFKDLEARDKKPSPESVWFSKEVIHNIVALLDSEKAAQLRQLGPRAKKGVTDGIRIYFGCDTSYHNAPLHNLILLVSTKDDGPSPHVSCLSGSLHLDYFDHCANAPLFHMGSYGEICRDGTKCPGDSLYITTRRTPNKDNCNQVLPHRIPRDTAEMMVQGFYGHPINTSSEWFDLCFWETLDKDKTHSGVRIYFATHPKVARDTTYSLRDALVITTTKYDTKTGTNVDYFDCADYTLYKQQYIIRYPQMSHHHYLPGQDNGELCPDNCDE